MLSGSVRICLFENADVCVKRRVSKRHVKDFIKSQRSYLTTVKVSKIHERSYFTVITRIQQPCREFAVFVELSEIQFVPVLCATGSQHLGSCVLAL
jgi:ribosome-interacting GTPase 1